MTIYLFIDNTRLTVCRFIDISKEEILIYRYLLRSKYGEMLICRL